MCAIRRVFASVESDAYFPRSRAVTEPGNNLRTPHNFVTAVLMTYGDDTAIPGTLVGRSFVLAVLPCVPAA